MDSLVISDHFTYKDGKIRGDDFEYIRVGEKPQREYEDYHLIIIDSSYYAPEYDTHRYCFEQVIDWGKIGSALFYGTSVIILLSPNCFYKDVTSMPLQEGLIIKINKKNGKNIIKDLKQMRVLYDYAQKIDSYGAIIDNIAKEDDKFFVHTYSEGERISYKVEPLAITEMSKEIIGGLIKVREGTLVILPALNMEKEKNFLYLCNFAKNLNPEQQKEEIFAPNWIKEFNVGNQAELKKKLFSHRENVEQINSSLFDISNYKMSLYLKHNELIEPIISVMNSLSISTHREEKYEEDLWILDDKEKKIIICEVKGTKKNVARKHINNLDNHREMNELSDKFPAILFINTFAEANSLKEKEVDISPDIIKHAVHNNILILRTLDLIYCYNLITSNKLKVTEFLDMLSSKVGWLKGSKDSIKIIKE